MWRRLLAALLPETEMGLQLLVLALLAAIIGPLTWRILAAGGVLGIVLGVVRHNMPREKE
jgi:hypothetical protein